MQTKNGNREAILLKVNPGKSRCVAFKWHQQSGRPNRADVLSELFREEFPLQGHFDYISHIVLMYVLLKWFY